MSRFLAALGPLAGRVLLSILFLYSGYQKVLVSPGRVASAIAGKGIPFATVAGYAAGAFELVVGVLLVLGLKARLAGIVAAAYVVLVTWVFHWRPASHGDPAQFIQLLKNACIVGGLLLVASYGPGPASLDRR